MESNLVDLFIDKLYHYLQKENLTFKKREFANSHEFYLCPSDDKDAIVLDKIFLSDNLSEYYFNLNRNKIEILPIVFKDLLKNYPEVIFQNLCSLPIFTKHDSSLDSNFGLLESMFNESDLINFLINYNKKMLSCKTYYGFYSLLTKLHDKFQNHKDYKDILISLFTKHKGLIRKKNGNIIGVRTWAIKNLNNIDFLEEFISIENKNPLFTDIVYNTMLKFLDVKVVQANYLIKNAKGVQDYHNLLKSLTSILNSDSAKTQLDIEKVEGNFVFDKKKYQLTIFSKKQLNSTSIENTIEVLLKAICDYYNLGENKPQDFENVVFKVFQYHNLNEKFTHKNQKIGKVQKI